MHDRFAFTFRRIAVLSNGLDIGTAAAYYTAGADGRGAETFFDCAAGLPGFSDLFKMFSDSAVGAANARRGLLRNPGVVSNIAVAGAAIC